MRTEWKPEEVKILVESYKKESDVSRLAELFGRSESSVKHKASRLNLKVRDGKAKKRIIKGKQYWYICKGRKAFFIHRLLMERMIGRELTSRDIVHHSDGDSLNNRKSNLVLTTRSEHMGYHREQCIKNLPQSNR